MSQCVSLAATEAEARFDHASVHFLGAATVVLRYGGFTVLVRPSFLHHHDHVHLGYDLAASGARGLASVIDQLPPVDFVLLPHLQDGHPGRAVDRELDRRLPLLTTRRAASALRRNGFVAARGLAGWETIRVERADAAVLVTSVPAQHPESVESFLPDAMGSVLEFAGPDGAVRMRAFVSGDAVVHGDLREVPRRPGVDLALLPVGGTSVLAVLASAEEHPAAVRLVAPRVPSPVPGGQDTVESSVEDFAAAVRRAGLEALVDSVGPGGAYVFRPSPLGAVPGNAPVAPSNDPVEAVGTFDGDRTVAA